MTDVAALYRRMLLGLWHADLADVPDLAAEIVTDDFVLHQQRTDGTPSELVHGPPALATLISESRTLFTDVQVTLDVGPVVDGDLVAARWTFHGRLTADVPGMDVPAGTEMTLSGHDIVRVGTGTQSGRFVEYWVCSTSPRPTH